MPPFSTAPVATAAASGRGVEPSGFEREGFVGQTGGPSGSVGKVNGTRAGRGHDGGVRAFGTRKDGRNEETGALEGEGEVEAEPRSDEHEVSLHEHASRPDAAEIQDHRGPSS